MESIPPTASELLVAIIDLKNATEHGFITHEGRMNARFEGIDSRIEGLEYRMSRRFEDLEYRMNRRFDRVDERFDELSGRVRTLETRAG